jgi:mannose-6-phosphate isomerase-like protein (cupin superfamily)
MKKFKEYIKNKDDKKQKSDMYLDYYKNLSPKNFKVKKIIVSPFCSLSLQKHQHRSEHWVVVKGKASVTCEDREFTLNENESTFIPLGKKHRPAYPRSITARITWPRSTRNHR